MSNTKKKNPRIARKSAVAVPEVKPDVVLLAEYVRRINKKLLEKDPLSGEFYVHSVTRAITAGLIEVERQGKFIFIDWNRYKDFRFVQYQKRNRY